MGPKPHETTEERQRIVRVMASHGVQAAEIAETLRISVRTLRRYYAAELEGVEGVREVRRVVESMARNLVPEAEIADLVGVSVARLRERFVRELGRGKERRFVESAVACGVTLKDVAAVLGLSEGKVRRNFRREIDGAAARAQVEAWGWLRRAAKQGSIEAVRVMVMRREQLGDAKWGDLFRQRDDAAAGGGAVVNLQVTAQEAQRMGGQGDLFEGVVEEPERYAALPLPPGTSPSEAQGGSAGPESAERK